MIFIISFVQIGDTEEVYSTNKVILCILVCMLSFYCQFKTQPFIIDDLNQLNAIGNTIMILTLLFALFSAICENTALKIFFLLALISLNCYFLMLAVKGCLETKFLNDKKSLIFQKIWKYLGYHCKLANILIDDFFIIFRSKESSD